MALPNGIPRHPSKKSKSKGKSTESQTARKKVKATEDSSATVAQWSSALQTKLKLVKLITQKGSEDLHR